MGNSNSTADVLYTEGLYPIYKNMYQFLLEKYGKTIEKEKATKNKQPITKRLAAIETFIKAMETPDNISKIQKARVDTLMVIYRDVLSYIKEQQTVTGGYTKSLTGDISQKEIIPSNIKTLDFAPVIEVKNVPSMSQTIRIEEIENAFKTYATKELKSIEAIKPNNKLLSKSSNIRPNMLWLLVAQLYKVLDTKETPAIEAQVHCIIQWYLLHNDTKGIDSDEYKTMLKTVRTRDADLLHFIQDVNTFLRYI